MYQEESYCDTFSFPKASRETGQRWYDEIVTTSDFILELHPSVLEMASGNQETATVGTSRLAKEKRIGKRLVSVV